MATPFRLRILGRAKNPPFSRFRRGREPARAEGTVGKGRRSPVMGHFAANSRRGRSITQSGRALARARAWDGKLDDHRAISQDVRGVDVKQMSAQSN